MKLVCSTVVCVVVPSIAFAEDPAKTAAFGWIDEHREELAAVNGRIWEAAEVGLDEHRSSAELARVLEANGFRIEKGVSGMPTAFIATYGSGKPEIGILAEYDALPGMSQKPEPRRAPLVEGGNGHGCGHSVFGTASIAAAIAASKAMAAGKLAGTIRLYGTPAEETGIGKCYMARDGVFSGLDAALHWHPGDRNAVSFSRSKAVVSVKYTFEGLAAHASLSPQDGRSALDAVELMNMGSNLLREHLAEDARIHYVITDGGGQPNVVPPSAQVWYYLRADSHDDVERLHARIEKIARGAALMTETSVTSRVDSDAHEMIPNRPLSELLQKNFEAAGAPCFTEEEKAFARATQEPLETARGGSRIEKTLADGIEPLTDEPELIKASTDVGDVSWMVPTGGLRVACYTSGAPGHSWQIVACTGMSIGQKGLYAAAKTLAGTALDLLRDREVIARAREDFDRRRAGTPYRTLIPEGQKPPARIR